jgi:hypothetical protein
MTDRTITIPANLWGHFRRAEELRAYVSFVRARDNQPNTCAAAILEHIADEIEKQAPREPGWYHVRDKQTGTDVMAVLWWDGEQWWREVTAVGGVRHYLANPGDEVEITPVTIGASS